MVRNRVVALSLLAMLVAAAGAQGTPPSGAAKRPVPGQKARADALATLQSIFKGEYAKKRPEDLANLGRALLKHAGETADEPATQYVMYVEAQRIALRAGDVATALAADGARAARFRVDAAAERTKLLTDASRTARTPEARRLLAAECIKHVDVLIAADQYDAAMGLLGRAEYLALRLRDAATTAQARQQKKRLLHVRGQFARLARAAEALRADPADPKANLAMGRFACFVKGDWAAGLPRLAKGSDGALRELARLSLSNPTQPADHNELADAWWAIAGKTRPPGRDEVRAYAATWYQLALPGLKGLARLRAQQRISEARAAGKGPGRVIDLLAKIDLARDGRPANKWALSGGTLRCVRGSMVPKVVLPYEPPEEYDVRFSFKQPKLRNAVGLVLAKAGASFAWLVGEDNGSACLFTVNGKLKGPAGPARKVAAGLIRPNRKYTSTVKVRNDGVKAYLNGRLVAGHKTDYKDMRNTIWHRIRKTEQIAIFADDPTIFYEITVTEITGRGKLLR